MIFRKTIFWLHLITGIISGIIVLIMSVTGVALTYQKQMTAWADKKIHGVQPPADASPLSVEQLVTRLHDARPDLAQGNLALFTDPAMPATVTMGRNPPTFLNPYTGEVVGEGQHGVRAFFTTMTDWHRWLALSGDSRAKGRAVTGAGNLIFLFLAISGLYLWWPSKWKRGTFRNIAWFRRGLTGKGRDLNWHRVFGFWLLVPLILVIISGVVISYPWASQLLYKMAGSQMAAQSGPPGGPGGQRGGPPGSGSPENQQILLQLDGLDKILGNVREQAGKWRTISFRPPTVDDKTISFSVDTSYGGQPYRRTTVVVDKATGDIVRQEQFKDADSGQRSRMWMRFVHTGEYYGFIGQTIAGIASIAGVILVWTGFALTFRRFFCRKNQ